MKEIAGKTWLGATIAPSRWGVLVVGAIAGAMLVATLTGPVSPPQAGLGRPAPTDPAAQPGSIGRLTDGPGTVRIADRIAGSTTPATALAEQRMPSFDHGLAPPEDETAPSSQSSSFFPCAFECVVVDMDAPIAGSSAVLRRYEDRLTATITTQGLVAGDVHTIWFMVFNAPEFCATNPAGPVRCGAQDVFSPLTKTSHMWAGNATAAADGTLSARGSVEVGDRAVFVWEPGLIDPSQAEVAIVIRSHGAPNGASDQRNAMNGGCVQAAVMPGTGSIGPNSCENKQAAAFPV